MTKGFAWHEDLIMYIYIHIHIHIHIEYTADEDKTKVISVDERVDGVEEDRETHWVENTHTHTHGYT